ncbi:GNAT family N-acetyltransferase [Virgibacillus doumboii]|uniref:GNAT family N-acetyltransferase n=1 Tax=Virgibacillus doumboii TaxID=2697503 RepID=UPI0013DEEDB9|nr:GNAT family protein [Virgibacillus doumboii]
MFLFEVDSEVKLKYMDIYDAEELFQLTDSSRESLSEWLAWVDDTKTADDSKAFIESMIKSFADRRGMTTGILYNGELAGVIGFHGFDWKNRIGSIGYWLGTAFHGNGIMTRATSGLLDYGFSRLKLNRVEIRAAYENYKSRAIPERLGFVKEGQIRQAEWLYDHYVDHVVYGMLANEWNECKK